MKPEEIEKIIENISYAIPKNFDKKALRYLVQAGHNSASQHFSAREKQAVAEAVKAERERIASEIENIPTDGHDKWYFCYQELARDIRANSELIGGTNGETLKQEG